MNRFLKTNIILVVLPFVAGSFVLLANFPRLQARDAVSSEKMPVSWWGIRSVDTMKLSRDLAREKLKDASFDSVIDIQAQIAVDVGASHLAIGTPYDDEFIPFMTRWVQKAREKGVKIWFRGNFSGWEGWFGYPKVSREEHLKKLQRFILNNESLFEDGDIFTSCPECENGGPGDPRKTGDIAGFRQFLIDEHAIAKKSFEMLKKDVQTNLYSMNGDVALLVMDKETTKALDGVITVDHYVKDPKTMKEDLKQYSRKSGGKIVVGEFGVPIPDIHGNISEENQAKLIREFFDVFAKNPDVIGVNYWVITEGSTALVTTDGKQRQGLSVLKEYYRPKEASGYIIDEIGNALGDIHVQTAYRAVKTDAKGFFRLPIATDGEIATISGSYTQEKVATLSAGRGNNTFVLTYTNESFVYKVVKFLHTHFPFIFGRTVELYRWL